MYICISVVYDQYWSLLEHLVQLELKWRGQLLMTSTGPWKYTYLVEIKLKGRGPLFMTGACPW